MLRIWIVLSCALFAVFSPPSNGQSEVQQRLQRFLKSTPKLERDAGIGQRAVLAEVLSRLIDRDNRLQMMDGRCSTDAT